ncbi:MAG: hypothetical protein RL667_323 [Pseudomonadota bacterium]
MDAQAQIKQTVTSNKVVLYMKQGGAVYEGQSQISTMWFF